MATIERRQLRRGISYRVEWRHEGVRHRLTYDNEQDALDWKRLIEVAKGDTAKADRAFLDESSSAPLLSEVAESHISTLIDTAAHTATKYRGYVEHHYATLDRPVDTITEDDIARWVHWMQTKGNRGKGYAPKTIKDSHGLLSSVLSYAVKRKHINHNPTSDTRLPKLTPGDERDKFLTREEFAAILPHVAPEFQPYAVFLFYTGLRASEMLALTPEDFTVADGVTYVSVTKGMKRDATGPGAHVGEPKTKRARRRIDVDDDTMTWVWPLVRSAGHGKPVFPVEPIQEVTILYRRMWLPAVKRARKAGFSKRPNLHSLRHSHASHMLALGMPMHEVSRRLGHASLAITDSVYSHMVPARQNAASRLLRGQGQKAIDADPAEIEG